MNGSVSISTLRKFPLRGEYMTTFTMIILIAFVLCLVWQFVAAIERDCIGLEIMFAAEILMFAYLAKTLM